MSCSWLMKTRKIGTCIIKHPMFRDLIIYFCYISVHNITPYMYIYYCTPYTWIGILQSAFIVPTPHCKAMRWILQHSAAKIEFVWILVADWAIQLLI